ncbi:GNAT family N-acetyltransferase [Wenxinia marina]|uniref:Wenxma_13, whole genome shotgun sequence n=1 Tax=Wenxinia marina DSM 24838 TaxID=1123501 RepID=A0A0D0NJ52_9RHOB|nr:GNAT family N-acetyltransferase [Wenxinia marina]KIQ68380.1 putative acetyltransferase [Wenxinia marina DSM 24838]GGL72682.1 acetyltransferase [Wenxinia marina]
MKLRRARPDEAEAIRALVREAYAPYVARIGREPAPMGENYAALIAEGCVFVPEGEGIEGVLVLIDEPEALMLDNVAVAASARGRGLGRALLEAAEAEARARGYALIRLYTHEKMTENRAIYARLGWRETHRAQQGPFARVFFEKAV